ncbi:MAG: ABC transporter ATP-binding protein/permease [Anaerolineae bacterium]|nr:ABC transporter ATP-binding protein/permease [Anaerolineae bacterium]
MQNNPRRRGPRPFSANNAPAKPWRERLKDARSAYANMLKALKIVWDAHRWGFAGMVAVTLVSAALPAAQAWVGKLIVDSVVDSIAQHGPISISDAWTTWAQLNEVLRPSLPYLLLEFLFIVLSSLVSQARRLLDHVLNAKLSNEINTAIIRKALSLDLQYFEDPTFYDKLQNARRESNWRVLNIVNTGFLLVQNIITLLSFAVLLLTFSPLITLLLFGASVPAFMAQMRYSQLTFRLLSWRAPEARRMNYFEYLLTVDHSAKEVKLFGLGESLLKQYQDYFWKFYHEDTKLAAKRSGVSVVWGLVSSLSFYIAYAWIIFRTITQVITLGGMTLYLSLCRQAQGLFQGIFTNINSLYESGLFLDNLFTYLALQPKAAPSGKGLAVPKPIKRGFEFRNVSFQYAGRSDFALRGVNLSIGPGEKIALVGANGAGKTTLIKLLTRLYEPTEGQILLDGVDLRDYDLNSLRDSVGVIFQDFVEYQASARDNIGYGQIKALDDEKRIHGAAERGGGDEVVATLPEQYDTMLGRWFDKGSELSGGQWQKIALSRAFMRDGAVLVLDEPTAALDAEREYEIFQRFRELTEGKIAVLISHRFSTVRMADRIAVIEGGRIGELGTHAELMQLNGTYARLFNMQAEGYR